MYEEFVNPKNGVYYAFIEVPVAVLSTPVPDKATNSKKLVKNAVYDHKGNIVEPAVYTQKTANEFIGFKIFSIDGTKLIAGLTTTYGVFGRMTGVTEADLAEWDTYLTPMGLGYGSNQWLTLEQVKTLLESPDYKGEE